MKLISDISVKTGLNEELVKGMALLFIGVFLYFAYKQMNKKKENFSNQLIATYGRCKLIKTKNYNGVEVKKVKKNGGLVLKVVRTPFDNYILKNWMKSNPDCCC